MLTIGGYKFGSRILVGTGKYDNFALMQRCHQASGAEMVTLAIRRVDLNAEPDANILNYIQRERIQILPNTAGCYTIQDAVTTAQLAREALGTDLIKLEVIGDEKTLYPDNQGTLQAAEILVKDGFVVLPYCLDDPVLCKRLEEVGCAAVMPLAAPIGSGLGIRNPYNLMMIVEEAKIPVIVDAGVGTASDVSIAMELGVDAVLLNTAIAKAKDPEKMAKAMGLAVEAGRLAFEAGRMPRRRYASASSPLDGVIGS